MRAYGYQADDLVPEETATDRSAGAPDRSPSFAEDGDAPGKFDVLISAQNTLDAAIDHAVDAGIDWDSIVDPLLAPILAALREGETPENLLIDMAAWYPQMDDTQLEETLVRALFVADIWGRVSAQTKEP